MSPEMIRMTSPTDYYQGFGHSPPGTDSGPAEVGSGQPTYRLRPDPRMKQDLVKFPAIELIASVRTSALFYEVAGPWQEDRDSPGSESSSSTSSASSPQSSRSETSSLSSPALSRATGPLRYLEGLLSLVASSTHFSLVLGSDADVGDGKTS